MKKWFVLFAAGVFALATSCQNEGNNSGLSSDLVKDGKKPAMKFKEVQHDFGKIAEGEVVAHTFEFTNTGDGDLIISDAVTSCGCTVPEYPKQPVKPGESGKIEVKFNSAGKKGLETKEISIIANTTPPNNELKITADVASNH